MPIAAVLTATLILSVSFFVFSSSIMSHPLLPIVPSVNVPASTTPTLLWNFTANQDAVFSPVVANGLVYATSENKFGSPVTLFCINASTGTQVWSSTGTFLNFDVANGYVYIIQAIEPNISAPPDAPFQGAISCLNAYNGTQLWYYSYSTQLGTPVVEWGIVHVDGANNVYALNASTGAQIWNYTGLESNTFNSPVLAGANLYVFSASLISDENFSWHSAVYALDPSTGKELWNYTTPGEFTSLIAAGQNVYVGCIASETSGQVISRSEVLALSASNGTRIWDYPINSSVGSTILANGTVYAVAGNGDIYALNTSDGRVIWKYATGLSTGSSLLVNGYLYVGSSAGVYCLNSHNGAVIWKFAASDFAGSSATDPAYADGVIYVGWNNPGLYSPVNQHNFYALDAANGKTLWNYTLGYTVISSPAVVDGTVYIGASFVNPLRDELNEEPGAVIALESNVPSLPLPSLPVSEPAHSLLSATAAVIIAVVIALIVISTAVFMLRKRMKAKLTSPPPTPRNST
jgi:outer membrane protein assembly factor BamB